MALLRSGFGGYIRQRGPKVPPMVAGAACSLTFGEEMKPPLHHRVLAHTAGFSAIVGAVMAVGILLLLLYDEGALIPEIWTIIWIALAIIPVAAAGWIAGLFFLWQFLAPIAARIQGWPFKIGENVRVLSGKYKGTVARIYDVWFERGQVRLELGEPARSSCADVFCAVVVCSEETDTEQVGDAKR